MNELNFGSLEASKRLVEAQVATLKQIIGECYLVLQTAGIKETSTNLPDAIKAALRIKELDNDPFMQFNHEQTEVEYLEQIAELKKELDLVNGKYELAIYDLEKLRRSLK